MTGRLRGMVRQRRWTTRQGEKTCWEYVVRLQPKPVTRSGFRLKADAEAALRDELTEREHGTWVEPSEQTLAEFLDVEWLPAIKADTRDTTYDLYQRMVRLHITPHIGETHLQSIRAKDVRDLYKMLKAPKEEGAEGS